MMKRSVRTYLNFSDCISNKNELLLLERKSIY